MPVTHEEAGCHLHRRVREGASEEPHRQCEHGEKVARTSMGREDEGFIWEEQADPDKWEGDPRKTWPQSEALGSRDITRPDFHVKDRPPCSVDCTFWEVGSGHPERRQGPWWPSK